MNPKNNIGGVLLFAGLLVGLYFLLKSSSSTQNAVPPENTILRLNPVSHDDSAPIRLTPSRSYDNEEVREITYNELGLPSRIVIHRHAVAA